MMVIPQRFNPWDSLRALQLPLPHRRNIRLRKGPGRAVVDRGGATAFSGRGDIHANSKGLVPLWTEYIMGLTAKQGDK